MSISYLMIWFSPESYGFRWGESRRTFEYSSAYSSQDSGCSDLGDLLESFLDIGTSGLRLCFILDRLAREFE